MAGVWLTQVPVLVRSYVSSDSLAEGTRGLAFPDADLLHEHQRSRDPRRLWGVGRREGVDWAAAEDGVLTRTEPLQDPAGVRPQRGRPLTPRKRRVARDCCVRSCADTRKHLDAHGPPGPIAHPRPCAGVAGRVGPSRSSLSPSPVGCPCSQSRCRWAFSRDALPSNQSVSAITGVCSGVRTVFRVPVLREVRVPRTAPSLSPPPAPLGCPRPTPPDQPARARLPQWSAPARDPLPTRVRRSPSRSVRFRGRDGP